METLLDSAKYKSFFEVYFDSFKGLEKNQQKNFNIKKEHSYRVASLMESIAEKANLDEEIKTLAYITGLFHDIGRFPQFIKFNTFNDDVSADHAAMAVEVLEKEGIFSDLSKELSEAVNSAIFFHNKFEVPKDLPPRTIELANLVRDADKLDILEMLSDYYENKNKELNHTLTWELPEGYKISDEVAKAILLKKPVPKTAIKNRMDIKVYQISWVYDLNYLPSFRIMSKNRCIERIYTTLPMSEKVIEFYRGVKIYIENQVNG